MKKKVVKHKPIIAGRSPIDMVWFKGRFDELERQHAIIVKLLNGGNVSQELETEIRRAMRAVRKIDQQVPDLFLSPNKPSKPKEKPKWQ